MDKYNSEIESVKFQKNKDIKKELFHNSCIDSTRVIIKLNETHNSNKSKQTIQKTKNPLKHSGFEKIIPMEMDTSLELNRVEYLKSIETKMKSKINDMKLLHVSTIIKKKKLSSHEIKIPL